MTDQDRGRTAASNNLRQGHHAGPQHRRPARSHRIVIIRNGEFVAAQKPPTETARAS